MKIVAVVLLLVAGLFVARSGSDELPKVPPFEEMLDWRPQPDRTMEVVFPGIRFRYSILDFKPAPSCQAVVEMVGTKELRWVTHAGIFAHQYLTKNTPMLFKRAGEGQWHWLNLKTYREK
jgi:hypothetical protein